MARTWRLALALVAGTVHPTEYDGPSLPAAHCGSGSSDLTEALLRRLLLPQDSRDMAALHSKLKSNSPEQKRNAIREGKHRTCASTGGEREADMRSLDARTR